MILYNYSSLQKRDTKIYNVGGYNIAGGFSVEFLKVVGPVAIVVIAIGAILGLPFGISFFNPFGGHFKPAWTIFWLVTGIGAGCVGARRRGTMQTAVRHAPVSPPNLCGEQRWDDTCCRCQCDFMLA